MGRVNKSALLMALNSISIAVENESNFVIKNYRTDLDDTQTIAMNEFKGKRGKKGKSLRDWH